MSKEQWMAGNYAFMNGLEYVVKQSDDWQRGFKRAVERRRMRIHGPGPRPKGVSMSFVGSGELADKLHAMIAKLK